MNRTRSTQPSVIIVMLLVIAFVFAGSLHNESLSAELHQAGRQHSYLTTNEGMPAQLLAKQVNAGTGNPSGPADIPTFIFTLNLLRSFRFQSQGNLPRRIP